MNIAYPGSIAEGNVTFASTVDVTVEERSELFNTISIYIPMSLAGANIIDFDPAWVTVERPAVITCTLESYKKYMTGQLLFQWQDVFIQDTNFDVTLHLIIFNDSDTPSLWKTDKNSIQFDPLTKAFKALSHISYIKTLYDETYDGTPTLVTIPATLGTNSEAQILFTNNGTANETISEGTYTFNDGTVDWTVQIGADIDLVPGQSSLPISIQADVIGSNVGLAAGPFAGTLSPTLPTDISMSVLEVTAGTDPAPATTVEKPSRYFDYALSLAILCKSDVKMSYFISMVKISFVDDKPNPADKCWIRLAKSADETQAMQSLITDDRQKYYWGALKLAGCTLNTWVLVHSEPINIVPLILAAWFRDRNESEQYVGNKLSLLRLKGTKIKPCGYPSWINSEVNVNDCDGIEIFKSKNVGFLRTIADNTPQESCVDSARSIDGTPVGAMMIAKYVDYTCAQECALFMTDEGTVTKPNLTNAKAYSRIQNIVSSNLLKFVPTGRITGISLKFPSFDKAKVGPRELKAARAWTAVYTDDLDKISVSGGITV